MHSSKGHQYVCNTPDPLLIQKSNIFSWLCFTVIEFCRAAVIQYWDGRLQFHSDGQLPTKSHNFISISILYRVSSCQNSEYSKSQVWIIYHVQCMHEVHFKRHEKSWLVHYLVGFFIISFQLMQFQKINSTKRWRLMVGSTKIFFVHS